MPHYAPDTATFLTSLGFNADDLSNVNCHTTIQNKDHPTLVIEAPTFRWRRDGTKPPAGRFCLDCTHPRNRHRRADEQPIPRLLVDPSRPRWKQSVLGWFTAATFKLQAMVAEDEVANHAQKQQALRQARAIEPLRGDVPALAWDCVVSHRFTAVTPELARIDELSLRYNWAAHFPAGASIEQRAAMVRGMITEMLRLGFKFGNGA